MNIINLFLKYLVPSLLALTYVLLTFTFSLNYQPLLNGLLIIVTVYSIVVSIIILRKKGLIFNNDRIFETYKNHPCAAFDCSSQRISNLSHLLLILFYSILLIFFGWLIFLFKLFKY